MEKRPIGYQVYSAREEAEKDLDSVLASLKKMGYDGVEFAGFYGHTAQEVAELLKKHGLIAISSHVPFVSIEADMFGIIAYHQAIGCKYIAVPYLDETMRPGAAGFGHAIAVIHRFARLMKEAGMTLLYHNHDFEFVKLSDEYGLDFLYHAVPEDLLKTELDTCWVKYAGEDPAAYIRKYAGRCPIIHLKDYVGRKGEATPYALIGLDENEKKAVSSFEFRPVGHGCQDVESLLTAGIESGADWFIVEQDMSVGRTPLEAAEMSIETLKKLGLK
ncbi:MAG: sugar phosphate isomerase/epimerase [Eubacteriales bacterium]|nr:sugar phosphate isomerase/epimerase [Eubacteriales bacterium]